MLCPILAASLLAAALSPAAAQVAPSSSPVVVVDIPDLEVLASRIEHNPAGRSISKIGREQIGTREAFSLKDLMETTPGVTFKQSNGPRDITISVRGSGAKTSFGIGNIKTYEDWFPTTQSDGLSRTDINDPNAYEGIDVIRGPSSSLYDDYALGGVVNFRSRRGRDIDGVDAGSSYGSHGYWNDYLHAGGASKELEYALFASGIGSDGYIRHSDFRTYTQNFTAVYTPDEKRRIVFKFLNNDLRASVPSRLTLDQLGADPFQSGTTNVTGVGVVSAEQAGQSRRDRRTIVGARYEYQAAPATSLRFMGAYDVKDIDQTFGTISRNINPNFHHYADLTHEGTLAGRPLRTFVGEFFNHMDQRADSFRNLADFNGTTGALNSSSRGFIQNIGGRVREEWDAAERVTAIAGAGVESSQVKADVQSRTAAEVYSRVDVDRKFWNAAPEAALVYRPRRDLAVHARVGMGYGIPSISQLSTGPDGLPGNNTALKPQRNLGFELGLDGSPAGALDLSLTGYYEFFYNEFVTASPGAGLSSFTTNAPRADHRGVELLAVWKPLRPLYWSNSYTFNDAVYRTFNETIGAGVTLNRAGQKVPGVERSILNSRLGAETADKTGAWLETNWVAPYWLNNSNTLRAPDSVTLNANAHYTRPVRRSWLKSITLYAEVHNLLDRRVPGSAVVVSDLATDNPATIAATKQAFFAGEPRGYYAGLKASF
jgi:iron complex outermembrane receptor protein